ncbi:hypothetical protein [Haloarcula sp. Atlit-120R]|uniref:hypothetical protein n=1 Tax=Haloarcula sp. Atlit-120R TaxID=2282135 RepID=UPI000EF1DE37|nr:hypothetical protein [Haloarcula sp. Atlit-120R]RLM39281.1 hypothetical protein DVK01_01600 [Haloarcula sp. Atlit-120R]
MSPDQTDAVVVRREPLRGPAQRNRYEPRDEGGWRRVEERWNGCQWIYVGSEIVDSIDIEGAEVLA